MLLHAIPDTDIAAAATAAAMTGNDAIVMDGDDDSGGRSVLLVETNDTCRAIARTSSIRRRLFDDRSNVEGEIACFYDDPNAIVIDDAGHDHIVYVVDDNPRPCKRLTLADDGVVATSASGGTTVARLSGTVAEPVKKPPGIPSIWVFSNITHLSDYYQSTLCTVGASTDEYDVICNKLYGARFSRSGRGIDDFKIIDIQRIQNLTLYKCYHNHLDRVRAINSQRPAHMRVADNEIERIMFHGTNKQACSAIIANGFNTKHAITERYFGHAVYLAKWASYSMRNFCPTSDPDGTRYLFIVRAIVGRQGKTVFNSVHPPAGCDSGCECDDPSRAEMAMVFNDAAVLPIYCVRFKKNE